MMDDGRWTMLTFILYGLWSVVYRPSSVLLARARVEGIAQAVAYQIKSQHRHHNRQPRKEQQVGRVEHAAPFRAEHRPPLGVGRLLAQAQEAQRRRIQDTC